MENNLLDEDDGGPSVSSLLSEILKKYNLEQDPDEEYKIIMEDGEQPNSVVVQLLSKDFTKDLISEKNFVDSLASKLKISSEVAQNIVKEIRERVVPLIKSNIKNKTTNKQTVIAQTKPEGDRTMVERLIEPKITKKFTESRPKIIRSPVKPSEEEGTKKIPRRPDNYREPIE